MKRFIAAGVFITFIIAAFVSNHSFPLWKSATVDTTTKIKNDHDSKLVVHDTALDNAGKTQLAPTQLSLSPAFNEYSQAVNYSERTEAVRQNIQGSLEHIVKGLQVDAATRDQILTLIATTLNEDTIREGLAQKLAASLSSEELEQLTKLFHDPVTQKVSAREDALLQQSPESLARYLEKYQDPEAYALVQKENAALIEELGIWSDVESLFQEIADSLVRGLNADRKVVSPELYSQVASNLLNSQRQVLSISTIYLYDELTAQELTRFKAIYKSPVATKERQIIYAYFGKIFSKLGSSMGQMAARSE